jgi:hypothetical protein
MSASTATLSSASVYTSPAFRERLWRTAGHPVRPLLHSRVHRLRRPPVVGGRIGRHTGSLLRHGDRMRSLIAAVFYGLAVLNLMWFAGRSGPS